MIKSIKNALPDKYDRCYKIQEQHLLALSEQCNGIKSNVEICKECKYYTKHSKGGING